MKTIVLLLVLASAAFADEYTPVDWIQVAEDGGEFGIRIGSITYVGCLGASFHIQVDDGVFILRSSKWQIRADDSDSWADVPETTIKGICYLANPTLPGEYRWVMDGFLDDVGRKFASSNTLTVEGESEAETEDESAVEETGDETAVEAVTWGFLKSRAAP